LKRFAIDRCASRSYWLSELCPRGPPPGGFCHSDIDQSPGLLGLALFVFFVVDSGAEDVGRVMLVLGWRLEGHRLIERGARA